MGDARFRPLHQVTQVQARAAQALLAASERHLGRFCRGLASYAVTVAGAGGPGDRVALLLKEDYVASFEAAERPFMAAFVGTQMFECAADGALQQLAGGG